MKKLLLSSILTVCALTSVSVFAATALTSGSNSAPTTVTFKGSVGVGTVAWGVVNEGTNTQAGNVVNLKTIQFGLNNNSSTTKFSLAPIGAQSTAINNGLISLGQKANFTWSAFSDNNSKNHNVTLQLETTGEAGAGVVLANTATPAMQYEILATAKSAIPGTFTDTATFTVDYK